MAKTKRICLSVDIPKNNMQTPKSIESLYLQLMSTYSKANLQEKYFKGKVQAETFGFEIVSLDGYIQFLIYCPSSTKDVVESAIFAQYPDAEIMEVPDYTQNFPDSFPSEEWDMWGSELDLKTPKEDFYPIKTYSDFIDEDAEELRYKDPLAGILEIMSKLKLGENLCIQMLVRPHDPGDSSWYKKVRAEINATIGVKEVAPVAKDGPVKALLSPFITIGKDVFSQLLTTEISKDADVKKEEKSDLTAWATKLKPDQKIAIELMEKKLSKKAMESKIRIMYIAKKESMNRAKGITGIMGTISQFNNPYGASLIPCGDVTTGIPKYFRVKQRVAKRQNLFIKAYKGRSMWRGKVKYHLNAEELASIFHFPNISVRAPMVTKVESKKVEPPMDLPTLD
ncbi:MAG: hypothetical protein QMB51_03665 [Patescibacteria group bacterium]